MKIRSTFTICRRPCCNRLGLEHTRLTYHYMGRDFRLTDVEGNVVKKLLV